MIADVLESEPRCVRQAAKCVHILNCLDILNIANFGLESLQIYANDLSDNDALKDFSPPFVKSSLSATSMT